MLVCRIGKLVVELSELCNLSFSQMQIWVTSLNRECLHSRFAQWHQMDIWHYLRTFEIDGFQIQWGETFLTLATFQIVCWVFVGENYFQFMDWNWSHPRPWLASSIEKLWQHFCTRYVLYSYTSRECRADRFGAEPATTRSPSAGGCRWGFDYQSSSNVCRRVQDETPNSNSDGCYDSWWGHSDLCCCGGTMLCDERFQSHAPRGYCWWNSAVAPLCRGKLDFW